MSKQETSKKPQNPAKKPELSRQVETDVRLKWPDLVNDCTIYVIHDPVENKTYSISENQELAGFGKNARVVFDRHLPNVIRLLACLKEIQKLRPDSNIAQQGFSDRVSQ